MKPSRERVRPGSPGPYLKIVDAISSTGCDASEIIEADGDAPRKRRCHSFTAEIVDVIENEDGTEDLVSTGETVTVWNKSNEAMTAGEDLVIGQRPNRRWTIVSWFCEG